MLKNYFKIAFRNITRNKTYSFINILGLTLGITCCSLLYLFVIDEVSYDDMHSDKDNIYRIVEIDDSEEETRYYGMTAPPVGAALVDEYEEIENYANIYRIGGQIPFDIGEDKYAERDYYFANQQFLQVFDFKFLIGDSKKALAEPNSIVIDEDWADILFGNDNPIGKEILIGGEHNYIVTGVIENVPQNSHLQFKLLVSYPLHIDFFKNYVADWNSFGAYTYLKFNKKSNVDQFTSKIPQFIDKHFEPEQNRDFYVQSLSDIHFNSSAIESGTEATKGEIAYIYIFAGVGLFMLLIACINYMNLATAKSLHRGKEIGMRKVSGAQRYQIVFQFLSESTIMALFSLALSVGLVDLLLPYFNSLTDKNFVFNTETFGSIFGLMFILTTLVGLLSGLYPAFLMSKLKPAHILKGSMTTSKGSVALRKILVITQFTLSIIMIIATIVATNQMSFIQDKSLGFNKEQLMIVDINNGDVRNRAETLINEFGNSPYIEKVSVSSRVPGEWKNLQQVFVKKDDNNDSLRSNFIGFDHRMLDVYKIQIKEGENFSGNALSDSLQVMINESAVSALNLSNPIGKYLSIGGGSFLITAVLKDFNFQSLHTAIAPLIIGYQKNPFQSIDYFSLKFDPKYTEEAIAHATAVHNKFDQSTPIEYHFLDAQWDLFYKNDIRSGNIFTIGAGITIFIACLGLFGLASFIIQQRTKEIGVRKVLGASMLDLFALLSKTFMFQVVIAFLIATPIAWYFMNTWLNNFAFHYDIGVTDLLISGVVAVVIALLSISYRVVKATLLNPANTLKDE